jgi:hypothetical protein
MEMNGTERHQASWQRASRRARDENAPTAAAVATITKSKRNSGMKENIPKCTDVEDCGCSIIRIDRSGRIFWLLDSRQFFPRPEATARPCTDLLSTETAA